MAVVTVAGRTKVAFSSYWPYHRWDVAVHGLYPSLGYLGQEAAGSWAYDPAASRTALQLQELNGGLGGVFAGDEDPWARSRVPQLHLGEIAVLPRSGFIVVARYLLQDLVVLTPEGELKGHHAVRIPAPTGCRWEADPKWVESDPSSAPGDERFFVQYDAYFWDSSGATPSWHHPVQEFSFAADQPDPARSIRSTTAAFYDERGRPFAGFGYDAAGTLWMGRGNPGGWGFHGGDVVAFAKDPATGTRVTLGHGSTALPAAWPRRGWGVACDASDFSVVVPGADSDGWVTGVLEDTRAGVVWLTTVFGYAIPITPVYRAGRLTAARRGSLIDPQVTALAAAQAPGRQVAPCKGCIDVDHRALWLPIRTQQQDPPDPAPVALPQWAYRIDLDSVAEGGGWGRATRVL